MAGEHAILSPSSSERWIACPASVRLAERAPRTSSIWADEGTHAHTRAEIEAALTFGLVDGAEYRSRLEAWKRVVKDPDQRLDMTTYAVQYVNLLIELVDSEPGSRLMLEQRMPTGIRSCWGTSDAVIISPRSLTIVDYKYGTGVKVDAAGNPQLRLYALGALQLADLLWEVEEVRYVVHQPRLDHISQESLTPKQLLEWRDSVASPAAEEALGPDPRFGPSLEACRFCPVAGECKPRAQHFGRMDFGDPDLLSPEEMAEALGRAPELRDWLKALEEAGLDRAYSRQEDIPGWKVVLSGGKRSIVDVPGATRALEDAGFPPDKVTRTTMETLGNLERLVGKKELPAILGDALKKSEGKPALVHEDDPRPEVNPSSEAKKEFR